MTPKVCKVCKKCGKAFLLDFEPENKKGTELCIRCLCDEMEEDKEKSTSSRSDS